MHFKNECACTISFVIAAVALLVSSSPSTCDAAQRGKPDRDQTIRKLIYESGDPKTAAKELLREAQRRGIDIDLRTKVRGGPIMFDSGPFYPQSEDTIFVGAMRERALTSPDTETVVVLYCSRSVSLRELASIMDMGVRLLYQAGSGLIASARPGLVEGLCRLPFVTWVGAYEPHFKYSEKDLREGQMTVRVHSLFASKPAFVDDIQRVGGKVLRHVEKDRWHYYVVEAQSDVVRSLAELEWVRSIDWRPPRRNPETEYGRLGPQSGPLYWSTDSRVHS